MSLINASFCFGVGWDEKSVDPYVTFRGENNSPTDELIFFIIYVYTVCACVCMRVCLAFYE